MNAATLLAGALAGGEDELSPHDCWLCLAYLYSGKAITSSQSMLAAAINAGLDGLSYHDILECLTSILNSGTIIPIQYIITATTDGNGAISPGGAFSVTAGANQAFSTTPTAGFSVNQWLLDGTVVQTGGSTYTLSNITTNHSVEVTFSINQYSLTVSAGSNGAISPTGTVVVNYGSNKAFAATPSANYQVNQWSVDGSVVQTGGNNFTLSNVTANHTVTVSFSIIVYALTVSAGSNGSISPTGSVNVNSGANQSFTATPSGGYFVLQWLVDGTVVQSGGTTFMLSNVQLTHTVHVTFIIPTPLIPPMTGYSTPSGVASASNDVGGYEAWRAFDGNSDFWDSNAPVPVWLQYKFPSAVVATSYALQAANGYGDWWVFQGSNDGATWVTLDTQAGPSGSGQAIYPSPVTFNISNSTAYLYYRVYIPQTNAVFIALVEFQINGF